VAQPPTATLSVVSTGAVTALAIPSGTGDLVIYADNASLLDVQGITAGIANQRLRIVSRAAGQVNFFSQHASAPAANRLINAVTSGPTPLAAGYGVADFVYDSSVSRWRLTGHLQGQPITVAYTAGDFTADAGTWTVDAGDLLAFRYLLTDRMLTVQVVLTSTTTNGVNVGLFVLIPNGYTISSVANVTASVTAAGVSGQGVAQVNNSVSTTQMRILKGDFSAWANGTNNNSASFTLPFLLD
jgi:hypothetical protein